MAEFILKITDAPEVSDSSVKIDAHFDPAVQKDLDFSQAQSMGVVMMSLLRDLMTKDGGTITKEHYVGKDGNIIDVTEDPPANGGPQLVKKEGFDA